MISLAIIGARAFDDYEFLSLEVKKQCIIWNIELKDINVIVGGHCKGADLLGEKFAGENKIKTLVLKPDWKKYGKSAGFRRNHDIVQSSSHIIAFPSQTGSGTQHSIKLAQKLGIPCHVVVFD